MSWQVKRLVDSARLPSRAHGSDLCHDIYVVSDDCFIGGSYELAPGERKVFRTGIKFRLPFGHSFILKDRSGNAVKKGLTVLAGVIDSNYTGEILVCLLNTSKDRWEISEGDRIAQGYIQRNESFEPEEVDELIEETDRGSTGS